MPVKKPLLTSKQPERYRQTFLIALLTAALFFVPVMLWDKGYFLFYGDFNVQQVPFYKMAHEALRSGNIFWNWSTDLGVNFVGSYSFYLLGSPFFWLTLPFPNWMVPYLMGPLLILKFACSALTAYCYLRRFCRYTHNAMIGALLYAFSGFSVYNIFFNHFHEAIVFFPLLLLSMELLMAENRRGWFALCVCLCAVSNYFFFFGMVVFCVIYFFIRLFGKAWEISVGRFLWLIAEAVLGLLLSMFILLPSILSVLQNSRVDSYLVGWDAILYGKNQIFLNIIQCFFFPPDLPARPLFFPNADVKWSSLGGWLPLFGMTGVIAWLQTKKGSWIKRVITVMIIMALIPILNSAFYRFNWAYYARWFYMPILIMALATAKSLEEKDINWASAFRWSAGITLAFTLVIGLLPRTYSDGKFSDFGLYTSPEDPVYRARFWIYCGIALASLAVLATLFGWRGTLKKRKDTVSDGKYIYGIRKRTAEFNTLLTVMICIVTVGYSLMFLGMGKALSYDTKGFIIPHLLEGQINLPDREDKYRIDVYDGMDNTGMFLGYPCIQSFHSIVPASVNEFYGFVGVERGVASRPETDNYQFRSLLNVRYLINHETAANFDESGTMKMPGWKYVDYQNSYRIYENDYYIPYGFTYDYCISLKSVDENYSNYHSQIMLKAMVLTQEQCEKYKNILPEIDINDYSGFDQEGYFMDCLARRKTSLSNTFKADNRGFTSAVELDRSNLVCYAIPYEDGWTATVDGVKVEIEKVNSGLMAVPISAGKHTVRFDYMTPGLPVGVIITIVAGALLALYWVLWSRYNKKYPERCTVGYPEGEHLAQELERDNRAVSEYRESLFSRDSKQLSFDAQAGAGEAEQSDEPRHNDPWHLFKRK